MLSGEFRINLPELGLPLRDQDIHGQAGPLKHPIRVVRLSDNNYPKQGKLWVPKMRSITSAQAGLEVFQLRQNNRLRRESQIARTQVIELSRPGNVVGK